MAQSTTLGDDLIRPDRRLPGGWEREQAYSREGAFISLTPGDWRGPASDARAPRLGAGWQAKCVEVRAALTFQGAALSYYRDQHTVRRAGKLTGALRPAAPTTSPGAAMTTTIPAALFADPAPAQRLERTAAALTAHGFSAEILDDAAAARTRIKDLIPEGASVFTGASETLRLSGIDADINTSRRYDAIRTRGLAMDRATQMDEIRRLLASPDVIVGSVAAVTETGSLVIASASGSRLPRLRWRLRPRDLDRRGAKGSTEPEHRAAPRRRPLPPAGKRPRHEGLRATQRHQPPSGPQRRTPPRRGTRVTSPRAVTWAPRSPTRWAGRRPRGCLAST